MKEKPYLSGLAILFAIVFSFTHSFAQGNGKWSSWESMPCYQGISVSVVNMGHSANAGGYLWGIRLRNDYSKPVTFRYRLSIGEKNESMEGGDAVWKLKPGEIWTDGDDKFTAKLYQSSSAEFNCFIWNVCFGDAKCSGAAGCYAQCDDSKGQENQPCGLEKTTEVKTRPVTSANGNEKTTAPGTKSNPGAINRAEIEKEARKLVDIYCKRSAVESKYIEADAEGKPTEAIRKELKALCEEFEKYSVYMTGKYSESKNKQAHDIYWKIWEEGRKKCVYNGSCEEFE